MSTTANDCKMVVCDQITAFAVLPIGGTLGFCFYGSMMINLCWTVISCRIVALREGVSAGFAEMAGKALEAVSIDTGALAEFSVLLHFTSRWK